MFSALKKLVGSEPGQLRDKNIPAGLQSMNQSLQRRFAKGVQYNMKIVIRGDRNTGKSTLWHRLQGKKFLEEYLPTQEIQATSIHWNYKTTDDVVKVEVWDVVDKGQKYPLLDGKGKKRGENLKMENETPESDEVALDAEFLDVYKNCNGVIMMFDITKQWTFNYILRELPKVPPHVPVCVLGNHRDMGEHRVILPDDIRDLIASLNRPMGASYIHYAESSMRNGFGLKYLHRFFNIPFLQLQRETLLRQLETNQLDMDATLEELCVQQETEDQNYEIFLENLETRSKAFGSPGPANGQSPSSGSQSPVVPQSGASTGSSSPSTPQPPTPFQNQGSAPQPPPAAPPSSAPPPPSTPAEPWGAVQSPEHPRLALSPASGASGAPRPSTPASPALAAPQDQAPQKRGFISRWFGSSGPPEAQSAAPDGGAEQPVCPASVRSVDDFVPDERLDRSFLEDGGGSKAKARPPAHSNVLDSDSDGEGRGNPMVSGFQDELDPDDQALPQPRGPARVQPPSRDVTLTSDEEDPPAPALTPHVLDLDSEPEMKRSVISTTKPKAAAKKGSEPKAPGQLLLTPAPISLTLTPTAEQPISRQQGKKKGNSPKAEDSDTETETPVAQQTLSFVMDDPDFESDASETPQVTKEVFPVRAELLSDLSEDEVRPAKGAVTLKPAVISFKHKNDTDLFGLGFGEEPATAKDSSDEQEEKESKPSLKEKKKKKKKGKEVEEEEKSKKKHKHRKKEKEEVAAGAAEDKDKEKKRKAKPSRAKKTDADELEDFLGGGGASVRPEGGDYEEL
ncbi:rab-like protein 6 [Gadus chalcogrammus]|uniref:rab-like protein 6 n=1 Tax=Gadus chalcogrammus TaxID=1042646 RepID=UPI0024C4D4B4|nr:rab-like protein 6 [Gadus chalcogrammus]